MGIDNIDILKPDGKVVVSQYIAVTDRRKYVFGWDQPLQSFYLQVHDLDLPEDDRIIVWLGATPATKMYEVEDLVRAARQNGYKISSRAQVKLYREKDDGI